MDWQCELECKIEWDNCLKRKELFDQNCHNAHAELCQHYSKPVKAKIRTIASLQSVVCNFPIELLKVIKKYLLYFKWLRYEMFTMCDAIKNFAKFRQKCKKGFLECARSFKLASEVPEFQISRLIALNKCAKDQWSWD